MNHGLDSAFHKEVIEETMRVTKRSSSVFLATTPEPCTSRMRTYLAAGEGSMAEQGEEKSVAPLLQLPSEVTRMIFDYLPFEQISKTREVCRGLNREARYTLNHGYVRFGETLEKARGQVKKQLPRRESERRTHALAKLADVYAALDTRKALLDMTYKKYIDSDLICFIPGKVLDEGLRLLGILQRCQDSGGVLTGDTCELLRDIRDLSSMAIEHFEESIEPRTKKSLDSTPRLSSVFKSMFGVSSASPVPSAPRFVSSSSRLHLRTASGSRAPSGWQRSMQEKINEQERVIQKQNEVIDQLRLAVTQLANYVEMPLDLQTGANDAVIDISSNQPASSDKISPDSKRKHVPDCGDDDEPGPSQAKRVRSNSD